MIKLMKAISTEAIGNDAAIQLDCMPLTMNWNLFIISGKPVLVSSTNTKHECGEWGNRIEAFKAIREEVNEFSAKQLNAVASILDDETYKAIYNTWSNRTKGDSYWVGTKNGYVVVKCEGDSGKRSYGARILIRFEDPEGIYVDTNSRKLHYVDAETRKVFE